MHDALFENQEALGPELYLSLVEALSLPPDGLKDAIERRTFRPKIRSDFMGGLKSGVNGTPTFFINVARHDAANEYEGFVAAIDAELRVGGGGQVPRFEARPVRSRFRPRSRQI
jgi:protein-disulfide isomerase